jgi:hypothetical protein
MPPVNKSASSTDVDCEATAELPVLDIAAYESSLEDTVHTDTWVLPAVAIDSESIPTLHVAADLESTADISIADFSNTHEMPAYPQLKNALKSATRAPLAASASVAAPAARNGHERPAARPVLTPEAVPAAAIPSAEPRPTNAAASSELRSMNATPSSELRSLNATPSAEPRATNAPAAKHESAPRSLAPAAPAPPAPIVVPPSPPLIEELRQALAASCRRIEELQERARIADAERGVAVGRANAEAAQLRQQLERHLEALQSTREQLAARHADDAAREDELFARADRIATLESDLAIQGKVLDEKVRALATALGRVESLDADTVNLRAAVARRDQQIAVLEADLVARQQRETALKARLEEAAASIDANVPQLRADIVARDAQIRSLERALQDAEARVVDKNEDLQVAEESIRNLENEVRVKTGKLEEANVTVEEWRAVIAESQRSILERDSRIRELQADLERRLAAAADTAAQTSEEVALEGPARVLIRTDGNTDFVHVLGRRTRIGRGSDNELVIDTKHISRYHAVLLAGPVHTTIEDLQSTNGVFVNGKRVTRQVLKDGDKLQVGRTQFRYSVRD